MKPTKDYDYEVTYWLRNFGVLTTKVPAKDALAAAQAVETPLKEKYEDGLELIFITIKRGSWATPSTT